MIFRLSQKLATKLKEGNLPVGAARRESVCGLVGPSVHGRPHPVHHRDEHEGVVFGGHVTAKASPNGG